MSETQTVRNAACSTLVWVMNKSRRIQARVMRNTMMRQFGGKPWFGHMTAAIATCTLCERMFYNNRVFRERMDHYRRNGQRFHITLYEAAERALHAVIHTQAVSQIGLGSCEADS